jgi:hypothetical protein
VFRKTLFIILAALTLSALHGFGSDSAPISLRDGLVWADVNCGGTTLHFVVDTGAVSSCLNLAAARRLGLQLGYPMEVSGVGGMALGYRCAGFQGKVGAMKLPGQVLALDLSGPARACSQPIDGLIGADFFQTNFVTIDYARGVLTRAGPATDGIAVRMRFENGVISVPVAVNGSRPRWTRLDTGCTDALIWCSPGTRRILCARHSVALASSTQSGPLAMVSVGHTAPHTLPVKWRTREIFPGEAGLLGNATLSRYRAITIDGSGKRLILSL